MSLAPQHLDRLEQLAAEFDALMTVIGEVQEGRLQIRTDAPFQPGRVLEDVLADLPRGAGSGLWLLLFPCLMEG